MLLNSTKIDQDSNKEKFFRKEKNKLSIIITHFHITVHPIHYPLLLTPHSISYPHLLTTRFTRYPLQPSAHSTYIRCYMLCRLL